MMLIDFRFLLQTLGALGTSTLFMCIKKGKMCESAKNLKISQNILTFGVTPVGATKCSGNKLKGE